MPITRDLRPDITFLRTHNLMNDHMIANLLKDRKSFIQQTATEEITKKKYLKSIEFELNVMRLCKQELKKYGPLAIYNPQHSIILICISNQIDYLYYTMFQNCSFKKELLIEYMEFQTNHKRFITNEIHPLVVLMSKKNCDSNLYITAATYQFEHHDIEAARNFFNEGILKHKNDKNLRIEQLWVEIQYLEDRKGEYPCQVAIQKYKETINYFQGDIVLHITLLEKSLQFKTMRSLHSAIISDFVELYKENDLMWKKVAELASEGLTYYHDQNLFEYTTNGECRARCCIKVYEKGLETLFDKEKKRNLIENFTEYLIKQWLTNSIKNYQIRYAVQDAMERAFQMGHFELGGLHKPEYYVYWAEHTQARRLNILRLAIEHNKSNVDPWTTVLELQITFNEPNYRFIKKIFEDGVQALKNDSLLLWDVMDSYLQNNNLKLLEEFYESGANSPYENINMVYRAEYLQWYVLYNDMASTRELFSNLTSIQPDCKKLYMIMIDYEKLVTPVNVVTIKDLYNIVCSRFGQQENEIKVFTDFIKFEFTYCNGLDAENVYNNVLQFVNPSLRRTLKDAYNSIKQDYIIRRSFIRNDRGIQSFSEGEEE
ncbi:unnamed protein product [Aphis gossypii]|uniref:U3 small nucleolar RNA-associated protein 6 n=1 Tax=Aphis gossypii TaxID=80765 RepID=A0A9P0JDN5_APHGO|nr:unnamed protein product [Aphis gossypii]